MEKKQLHENFMAFVRDHGDNIGSPVDFIIPSEDKSRIIEVNEWVYSIIM